MNWAVSRQHRLQCSFKVYGAMFTCLPHPGNRVVSLRGRNLKDEIYLNKIEKMGHGLSQV